MEAYTLECRRIPVCLPGLQEKHRRDVFDPEGCVAKQAVSKFPSLVFRDGAYPCMYVQTQIKI
jgi:hypothetical protein